MADISVFDGYGEISERRMEFMEGLLPELISTSDLQTALDAGCGVGIFSQFLSDMGMKVTGFDARNENLAEAKRRYSHLSFKLWDVEDPRIPDRGSFDMVFCLGLLYHLENPFRAIRNLSSMAKKVIVIESMVSPKSLPAAVLVDETPGPDQAIQNVAFVPTEACLIKMLYRAGFLHVYRPKKMPKHEDFRNTLRFRRRRTILIASKENLSLAGFSQILEPKSIELWQRKGAELLHRFFKILSKGVKRHFHTRSG
ncbi:class I SAM-dependent methyltransferase [Thermodesulfobacteriota bacterium]